MINKVILSPQETQQIIPNSDFYYVRVFPKYEDDHIVMWEKKVGVLDDNIVDIVSKEILEELKTKVSSIIKKYDTSTSVNSFKVNGVDTWLDKSTRVGLVNSIATLKALEKDTMTLWLNDIPYTINVDALQQMLIQLEDYAIQCYNQTSIHLATVSGMSDPYMIEEYDYTQGYPDKLEFIV